jgi:hypothetical protein
MAFILPIKLRDPLLLAPSLWRPYGYVFDKDVCVDLDLGRSDGHRSQRC